MMWTEARRLCSRASHALGHGDHEVARRLANEALAIEGFANTEHAAQAHDVRGDVFRSAGRFDEALSDYQAVTAWQPSQWHGHIKVAEVFIRLSRFDEALASVDRAITLTPDDAPGTWALGQRLTHLVTQVRTDSSPEGLGAFKEIAERCLRVSEDGCASFPDHPMNRHLRALRSKARELAEPE